MSVPERANGGLEHRLLCFGCGAHGSSGRQGPGTQGSGGGAVGWRVAPKQVVRIERPMAVGQGAHEVGQPCRRRPLVGAAGHKAARAKGWESRRTRLAAARDSATAAPPAGQDGQSSTRQASRRKMERHGHMRTVIATRMSGRRQAPSSIRIGHIPAHVGSTSFHMENSAKLPLDANGAAGPLHSCRRHSSWWALRCFASALQ